MLKEAQYCQKIIATKFKKPLKMTDKDEQNFQDANECHICNHKWKPPLFKVLSPSFIFTWTAATITIHLKYAQMLAIVVHENMKLGDNTLNNERLTLVNTKLLTKYVRIVALILLPYNVTKILKLKGHIKGRWISWILIFSIERFKNHSLIC